MCSEAERTDITVQTYVTALWKRFQGAEPAEGIWLSGRQRGWLEEQDQLYKDFPIERRNAARILHEFLRIEKQLPDERDWGLAKKLEDLYHCRACAKHVAQVVVRGLIPPQSDKRFGLLGHMTYEEMQAVFERAALLK
ncbi:MAG: hypothetical protein KBT01_06405 [Clostridiales bacterium]|nr:hypothetical protein [Candidatus Blautia equi]